MRKILLLLQVILLLGFTQRVYSQSTANYAFTTDTNGSLLLDANNNSIDMATGTTLVAAASDQGVSPLTNIGFDFIFMGNLFTQFTASANGVMQLGSTVAGTTYVTSGGSASAPRIGAFTADMITASSADGGGVFSKLVGSAPNRCLVIQWVDYLWWQNTTPVATWQVRLYETTGVVEYVYGSMVNGSTVATSYTTGFSSGTAANTQASVTTSNNSVNTSATFNTNTYTVSTAVANLNSVANGSRRIYKFTPPGIPNIPTGLNFTAVTANSMTVNWTDATNEVKYLLLRSDDGGVNYNNSTSLNQNIVTSGIVTGLLPNTTYYWKLYSLSEGSISAISLDGSQITAAAGTKTSNVGAVNWNNAASWTPSGIPTATDDVVISDGSIMTIDITTATCNNLTVGQGTSGVLIYQNTPLAGLAVINSITIAANGTFNAGAGTLATHTLGIGGTASISSPGSLINNGVFDMNTTAGVTTTFLGNLNGSVSGSGTTTDFYSIVVNKGTTQTGATLDIAVPITQNAPSAAANRLVVTAGTFKLSSASAITPYYGASTVTAAAGRLWLNNASASIQAVGVATATGPGIITVTGELRIDNGTFGCGSGSTALTFTSGSGVLRMSGGTLNVYGNVSFPSSATTQFIMSGGSFNVDPQSGANLATGTATFSIGASTTVDWSNGSITIVDPNATTGNTSWTATTGGVKNITGGTLFIGDGTSASTGGATANTNGFGLLSTMPVYNLVINNNISGSATRIARLTGGVTVNNNLTINANSYVFLGSGTTTQILTVKGNVIQNGVLAGCESGGTQSIGTLYFNGQSGAQTLSGTGTFVNNSTISLDNAGGTGITFSNANLYKVNRVNLFDGSINPGSNFTVGNPSALTGETPVIQYGGNGGTLAAGTFTTFPTIDETDGLRILIYSTATNTFTMGFNGEIATGSQTLTALTINNTTGLTIPAGITPLNINSTLTMAAGNIILNGNAVTLGTSATVPGTLTYTTGLIQGGTFTRWLGTASLPTTIANGNAGHFPIGYNGLNRSLWLSFSAAAALSTGGTVTVGHTNATGVSGIGAFTDGGQNVDTRTNASWTVSQTGLVLAGANTINARIQGSGGLATVGAVANLRFIRATDAVGTSANGTNTAIDPQINRTGLVIADLTNTFYIGGPSADLGVPPITWVGTTGNWSVGSNWSTGNVPTSSDNIQISPATVGTITVDGNYTVNDILIGTNATVSLGVNTLTINRNFGQTAGTFNAGSGILDVKSNFVRTGGTFTGGTSTTTFTGTTQSINVTGAATTFNNLSIIGAGTKTFTTGATYATTGNLTVASGVLLDLSAPTATSISVGGDLDYTSSVGGTNIGSLTLNLTGTTKNLIAGTGLAIPNILVATTASYTLGTDIEMTTGRTLSVSGRLNLGNNMVSGAGNLTVTGASGIGTQGILGTTSTSGFNNITVSGTKNYNNLGSAAVAAIDYNGAVDQVIDIATHPANTFIMCSNSGTKTLNGNYTFTVVSNTGAPSTSAAASRGALTVNAGATFADGGYTITFPDNTAPYANVIVLGNYNSTGAGKLVWKLCSASAIFAVDGTTFGDLDLGMTTATCNMRAADGTSTVNITARNMNFISTTGTSIWNLSALGTTNLTVTGNVNFVSTDAGGFDGTTGKTTVVNLKGNIASLSTATTHNIIGSTGTNTLLLNGTSPQTISLAGTNPTIIGTAATLKIDNVNGFTIGQALTIGGALNMVQGTLSTGANNLTFGTSSSAVFGSKSTLDIGSGSTVAFATRPVTLQSDVNGTARIANVQGSLTGTTAVTVQRYIAGGKRAFRFLAHPFNAAMPLSQVTDDIDITGNASDAVGGFVSSGTNNPSAFYYDATTGDGNTINDLVGWKPYTAAANTVGIGNGYRVLVRGAKGNLSPVTPVAVTLSSTGALNPAGDFAKSLTYGPGLPSFNLIGNPYASPVNVKTLTKTAGVNNNFWIWNARIGSAGAYIPYTFGTSDYALPSSTSFFVQTTGAGETVTFKEADKTASDTSTMLRQSPVKGMVEMTINTADGMWDRFALFFDRKGKSGTDKILDGAKMHNSEVNFYSINTDKKALSIDVRPYDAETVIPMGFTSNKQRTYTINVNAMNVDGNNELYLSDKYLGTITKLEEGTSYEFTVDANAASQGEQRFELFGKAVKPIAITTEFAVSLAPNPATDFVKVSFTNKVQQVTTVRILNANGSVVKTINAGSVQNGQLTVPVKGLAKGIYTVQLTSGTDTKTSKLVIQ